MHVPETAAVYGHPGQGFAFIEIEEYRLAKASQLQYNAMVTLWMTEAETSQTGPPQYATPPQPLCEMKTEEVGTAFQPVVMQLQPLKVPASAPFEMPLMKLIDVRY